LHLNGFSQFGAPRRRCKNNSTINVNKANNARNKETTKHVPATIVEEEK